MFVQIQTETEGSLLVGTHFRYFEIPTVITPSSDVVDDVQVDLNMKLLQTKLQVALIRGWSCGRGKIRKI